MQTGAEKVSGPGSGLSGESVARKELGHLHLEARILWEVV